MRQENIYDISSLGGNPVYISVAVLFWLFGHVNVTYRLAVALILCYAVTTFFRLAIFRERPQKQKFKNVLERIDASSFPSLHSMRAAVWALSAAVFFNQPFVWILAAITALSVAAARVLQKRHHLTDAMAGLIAGSAIAFVSPLVFSLVMP